MKHSFSTYFEYPSTILQVVANKLDVEHYASAHDDFFRDVKIVEDTDHTARLKLKIKHLITFSNELEYDYSELPFRFKETARGPYGVFRMVLEYQEDVSKGITIARKQYEWEFPFYLYPFKNMIARAVRQQYLAAAEEDCEILSRRTKLFGKNYVADYLVPKNFLLFKDRFVDWLSKSGDTRWKERSSH